MDGQGCSDLPADVNGRSLDRIAGLEKIIAPELVEQAVLPLSQSGVRILACHQLRSQRRVCHVQLLLEALQIGDDVGEIL